MNRATRQSVTEIFSQTVPKIVNAEECAKEYAKLVRKLPFVSQLRLGFAKVVSELSARKLKRDLATNPDLKEAFKKRAEQYGEVSIYTIQRGRRSQQYVGSGYIIGFMQEALEKTENSWASKVEARLTVDSIRNSMDWGPDLLAYRPQKTF